MSRPTSVERAAEAAAHLESRSVTRLVSLRPMPWIQGPAGSLCGSRTSPADGRHALCPAIRSSTRPARPPRRAQARTTVGSPSRPEAAAPDGMQCLTAVRSSSRRTGGAVRLCKTWPAPGPASADRSHRAWATAVPYGAGRPGAAPVASAPAGEAWMSAGPVPRVW